MNYQKIASAVNSMTHSELERALQLRREIDKVQGFGVCEGLGLSVMLVPPNTSADIPHAQEPNIEITTNWGNFVFIVNGTQVSVDMNEWKKHVVRAGSKIARIKAIRMMTGFGLLESKDLYDYIWEGDCKELPHGVI